WQVSRGSTTPGDMVTIAYLLTVIAAPLRALGWLFGGFPASVAGFSRVQSVLDSPDVVQYGTAALDRRGGAALAVRGLRFAHDAAPVVDGVDFTVDPGRSVALVGETASGKSTLAMLLARLLEPDEGEITIDGVRLDDLRRGELAVHAAFVPQQAFVFDDTVVGNVALGRDLTADEVWAALRVAAADDFVAALPDGLETRLGERGTSLSGGQRQRLALARAVAGRPRLLILDDATSALDPDVEARVLRGIRALGDTTLVIVAYRKAAITTADEVLFLNGGVVAARGTHDELTGSSAAYRRLVDAYDRKRDA
ncbi:MAG: ABC transporter ATP-binding protein, partial [Gordonia sp. (in: high G+C Gram-positive bacteria)]